MHAKISSVNQGPKLHAVIPEIVYSKVIAQSAFFKHKLNVTFSFKSPSNSSEVKQGLQGYRQMCFRYLVNV